MFRKHKLNEKTLTPGETPYILSWKENGKRIEDSPEPLDKYSTEDRKLEKEITKQGVNKPVIIIERRAMNILIEGQKRAYIAYKNKKPLPAYVISCTCKTHSIEPCNEAKELIQEQNL